MQRTVLKTICIVSGVILVALSLFLVISAVQAYQEANRASIGIIGGADAPTAMFLLGQIMRTPFGYAAGVALLAFVGTGASLIFDKKSQK